ncbi:MAG TPA: ABC transporter ATP-binding protein [Anaerolineae bacterium]|nr:ABC transporter ATP-binding protein [Anaerolineae bacterium]
MSITIKNLSHTYTTPGLPPRPVIHPIPHWHIPTNTQLILRGISGSGKTTLFNILAGLLQPTTGTILFNDTDLYALSESQRDRFRNQAIGYVFQMHHLLPMLTAAQNVAMPLAFAGQPKNERRPRALHLLDQVGLADHAHNRPAQMSTGQRLRVAIARAIANKPQLLLADEPTAALDPATSDTILGLLQQTCAQNNTILILASHDPAIFDRFNHIYNLHEGHLDLPVPAHQ